MGKPQNQNAKPKPPSQANDVNPINSSGSDQAAEASTTEKPPEAAGKDLAARPKVTVSVKVREPKSKYADHAKFSKFKKGGRK
jgi:hypothetical protein